MAEVTAKLVKKLRDMTGSSVALCKKALDDTDGNMDKALAILKKSSEALAAKKEERATGAGVVEAYVHGNRKVGVLLVLRCETDFVAKNEEFRALAHDLALHIAGMGSKYVSADSIPEEVKEEAKRVFAEEAERLGKNPEMAKKIVEGKLEKHFSEISLLSQSYVKDDTITVGGVLKRAIAHFGEKIEVARFERYNI